MVRYVIGTETGLEPVNLERALRPVVRAGFTPADVCYDLANRVVRRCQTDASAISYGQEIASVLRYLTSIGVDPLGAEEDDLNAYLASLSGYAEGTRHLKMLVARLFYKKAIERKLIDRNPAVMPASLRRTPERWTPALTKTQIEHVLGSLLPLFDGRTGLTAKRDFTLITVTVRLCLRASEVAGLRWGRFFESNGQRYIGFKGKGRKPASLKIPGDLWRTLEAWRLAYEAATDTTLGPNDPVFVAMSTRDLKAARARTGASPLRPLGRGRVCSMVTERLRDAGVTGSRMSPHALRATGAVLAYLNGATLIDCQQLLRHSSIETTMRYLQRLVEGAGSRAIDAIVLDVPAWTAEPDAHHAATRAVA